MRMKREKRMLSLRCGVDENINIVHGVDREECALPVSCLRQPAKDKRLFTYTCNLVLMIEFCKFYIVFDTKN